MVSMENINAPFFLFHPEKKVIRDTAQLRGIHNSKTVSDLKFQQNSNLNSAMWYLAP